MQFTQQQIIQMVAERFNFQVSQVKSIYSLTIGYYPVTNINYQSNVFYFGQIMGVIPTGNSPQLIIPDSSGSDLVVFQVPSGVSETLVINIDNLLFSWGSLVSLVFVGYQITFNS